MLGTRAFRLSWIAWSGSVGLALAGCAGLDPDPGTGAGDEAAGAVPAEVAESEAVSGLAGCTTHVAGGGFGAQALAATATGLVIADFTATAAIDPALDAVISLANVVPTSFNHLATSVRFSTAGVLDVRDGASYHADATVPFALGQARRIRIVADIPSHTFSVYVDTGYSITAQLAKRYAFRTTTATLTALSQLAAIVDGAAGELTLCDVTTQAPTAVAYTREGTYGVVPLASNRALVSDGATVTMRLAANGTVLNQVARGGALAADPSERAYVARVNGSALEIDAYTATLGARWSQSEALGAATTIVGAAADATGLTLALSSGGAISIKRYPAAGGAGTVLYTGGTHAAVAADGFAVANRTGTAFDVSMFAPDGTLQWTQSYPGAVSARIAGMTLGLAGRVAIAGDFSSAITFGGPVLEPTGSEVRVNSYVVGLDRDDAGAHVFTNRVNVTQVTGLAANAGRVIVSGERIVTPIFPDLFQYDASGAALAHAPYDGFWEQWGRSGRVAIGASNRIYWERRMLWPGPFATSYPYLIALTQ